MSLRLLLQRRPASFISLGLGVGDFQVIEPISEALPALARDMDGGYRVRLGDVERAAHIEFNRRHLSRLELTHDVLEAQTRLFRREGVKVFSLVYDLYGDPNDPLLSDEEEAFCVDLGKGSPGRFSRCVWRRVNLRGLPWRSLLAQSAPGLWALFPLTREGTSRDALLAARDAIEVRTDVSPVEQADQLAALWFLAEAEDVASAVVRGVYKRGATHAEQPVSRNLGEGQGQGPSAGHGGPAAGGRRVVRAALRP